MSQRKKNNIILGSLCAVVLLMVVGYAAFQSVLNITGTSKVSSNWNILITNIETKNIVGGASNASEPTGKGTLTATFNTNLVSPGDSIEYDITVSNQGTLNAVLEKITVSDTNNPAIKFTTTGITEGDPLNAGGSAVLTVKVEYDNAVTSQPDNLKSELTVTLDYVQEGTSTVVPGGDTFTGIVYSANATTLTSEGMPVYSINIGDTFSSIGETTEDYNTLEYEKPCFLKHVINNGKVESTEVCFNHKGLNCLKPNDYETSKAIIGSGSKCDDNTCWNSWGHSAFIITVKANDDGTVSAGDDISECHVFADGSAACIVRQ